MPFDATGYTKTDAPVSLLDEFKVRPTLRALAVILRDPTMWPEGFVWDFVNARTCACGLANAIVGRPHTDINTTAREMFGLRLGQVGRLFGNNAYWPIKDCKVTAGMVADRIEQR
jgi:hypothetical protein